MNPKTSGKSLLVLSSQNDPLHYIHDVIRKHNGQDILYISTSIGVDALISSLKDADIDTSDIRILDCVTSTVVKPKKQKNCIFVSSPAALTDISIALNKALDAGCDLVVLDSLSTLMIYSKEDVLIHFVHHLVNEVGMKIGATLLLSISEADKGSYIYKKVASLVDEVRE